MLIGICDLFHVLSNQTAGLINNKPALQSSLKIRAGSGKIKTYFLVPVQVDVALPPYIASRVVAKV
jgi:hypothetical protein